MAITAPTGLELDQGVVDNISALSPCPVCGANALSGPEGWGWAHLPHCWRCGYNWVKPSAAVINAPVVPSLAPAQVASLAQAVVAQLKEAGWAPPAPAQEAIPASSTETGWAPPAPAQEAIPASSTETGGEAA